MPEPTTIPALETIKPTIYGDRFCVYLIHLSEPLKHARHYVGSTRDLVERMRCYRAGNADASAFMRAVSRAGIAWTLARVWTFPDEQSARDFEYTFKKGANGKQQRKSKFYCPTCAPAAPAANAERMRRLRARRQAAAAAAEEQACLTI